MTTTLEGSEGSRHAPAARYPWERPGTHCTGGWVGPRAGLDRCGKSRPPPGFDPRTVQPVASRYTDYAPRPFWSTETPKIPELLKSKRSPVPQNFNETGYSAIPSVRGRGQLHNLHNHANKIWMCLRRQHCEGCLAQHKSVLTRGQALQMHL